MFVLILTQISAKEVEAVVTGGASVATRVRPNRIQKSALIALKDKWEKFYLSENRVNSDEVHLYAKVRLMGTELTRLLFDQDSISLGPGEVFNFISDPQLVTLPVEIISCDDGLLADKAPILRSLKTLGEGRQSQSIVGNDQMLVLRDSTEQPEMRSEPESVDIFAALKSSRISAEFLLADRIRLDDVRGRLQSISFFHYAGHASAEQIHLWKSEKLTAGSLEGLNLSNIKVVFINSCDSTKTSNRGKELGQAFISAGAKTYIGYALPISAEQAHFIGREFWRNYRKLTLPYVALHQARAAARNRFGSKDLGWLTLHCYASGNEIGKTQNTIWRGRYYLLSASVALLLMGGWFLLPKRQTETNSHSNDRKVVNSNGKAISKGKSDQRADDKKSHNPVANVTLPKMNDKPTEATSLGNIQEYQDIYNAATGGNFNTLNKSCRSIMNNFRLIFNKISKTDPSDWDEVNRKRLDEAKSTVVLNRCLSANKISQQPKVNDMQQSYSEAFWDVREEKAMQKFASLVTEQKYKAPAGTDCYLLSASFPISLKSHIQTRELEPPAGEPGSNSGYLRSSAKQIQSQWRRLTEAGCIHESQ